MSINLADIVNQVIAGLIVLVIAGAISYSVKKPWRILELVLGLLVTVMVVLLEVYYIYSFYYQANVQDPPVINLITLFLALVWPICVALNLWHFRIRAQKEEQRIREKYGLDKNS
jgi:hypothetical protein